MYKSQLLVLTAVTLLTSISCRRGDPVITLNELTEPITTHTEVIDEFLKKPVDENVKAEGKAELSKPNPVHLSWNYSDSINSNEFYTVKIAEEEDLLNPYVVTTSNNYLDFYNSKINTTYYYRVEKGSIKSNISTFRCSDTQLRMINIDGVTNCRDLGGYNTTDGKKIKQGVIYRTARFNKSHETARVIYEITPKGINTLKKQLHVKTEIDLRENDEACGQAYDGYIPGVRYKAYNMIYDGTNILLDNKDKVKKLFEEVLSKPESYPLDFHCSIGTDRTGCIAYTLLALCGVEEDTLIGDYLLSNYGMIRGPRQFSKIKNTYPLTLKNGEATLTKDTAAKALIDECDISIDTINKIRDILIEE